MDIVKQVFECEVLVLPVQKQETRAVSFQLRLVLFLSRRVSRDMRQDGSNILLSGTVVHRVTYFGKLSKLNVNMDRPLNINFGKHSHAKCSNLNFMQHICLTL